MQATTPDSITAAAALLAGRGVFGLAWLDDELVVTAKYGDLVDFVTVGEPAFLSVPPLFGLDEDIRALKHHEGAALNIPAVSIISSSDDTQKMNLLILWSTAESSYLLVMSRAVTKADLEVELSRQIRARLMAETELKRKSVELSRANRDLEEYAAIISHDLKAPLRAMRYLASDIEKEIEGGTRPNAALMLEQLREQALRMSAMMSALLDYSSIGRKAEALTPVDTLSLVKSIIRSCAPPSGIRIELHGEWPRIETLEAPLDLVLRNLINNAVMHHDRETGVVRVVAMVGNNDLEFTVADDGPGIAPEHHEAIFLPFRTLHGAPRPGENGMGLSLVKRTLESIKGRIAVESDPSSRRGTAFRVVWPRRIES